MEFPMIINSSDFDNPQRMTSLVAHEVIHSYFPFRIMTNESDYAFMDEGLASFFEGETMTRINKRKNADEVPECNLNIFHALSGRVREAPPMVRSYAITDNPAFMQPPYGRPSIAFFPLKDMLGA